MSSEEVRTPTFHTAPKKRGVYPAKKIAAKKNRAIKKFRQNFT